MSRPTVLIYRPKVAKRVANDGAIPGVFELYSDHRDSGSGKLIDTFDTMAEAASYCVANSLTPSLRDLEYHPLPLADGKTLADLYNHCEESIIDDERRGL
jgi:hypothetical protein